MRLAQFAGKRLMVAANRGIVADAAALFAGMELVVAQQHLNLRLREAIELSGCPICRTVLQRVTQSMRSIDYEFVNDPGWRADVETAWGFCNLHAQQWLDSAHPLGTALIYEAVLGRIREQMDRQRSARSGLARKLRGSLGGVATNGAALIESGTCPLCIVRESEAKMTIAQLMDELTTPAFREQYLASDGLCVTHLNAALRLDATSDAIDVLRMRLDSAHQQLQEQLQEIIRKYDYRYHNELLGDDRGSVERAVHQVAGLPGIGDRRFHPPVAG